MQRACHRLLADNVGTDRGTAFVRGFISVSNLISFNRMWQRCEVWSCGQSVRINPSINVTEPKIRANWCCFLTSPIASRNGSSCRQVIPPFLHWPAFLLESLPWPCYQGWRWKRAIGSHTVCSPLAIAKSSPVGFSFFSVCSSKLHFHTPKMPRLSQRLPDGYYTLNYNCTVREFSFLMVCQCVPFQKIISIEVSSSGRKQSRRMQAAPSSGQLIWTRDPVRGWRRKCWMRTVGSTGHFSWAVNLQWRCWQQHSVIMGSGEARAGLCCNGQGRMEFTGSNSNADLLQACQVCIDKLLSSFWRQGQRSARLE